jgi:hypothetical protein
MGAKPESAGTAGSDSKYSTESCGGALPEKLSGLNKPDAALGEGLEEEGGFLCVEAFQSGDRQTREVCFLPKDVMTIDQNENGCAIRLHREHTALMVHCPNHSARQIAKLVWRKYLRFALLIYAGRSDAASLEAMLEAVATEALNALDTKLLQIMGPKALTEKIGAQVKVLVQQQLEQMAQA